MKRSPLLTFDDVLITPQYSEVMSRADCDISWKLKQYKFTFPIIPANMESITGIEMCKFIASLGGLGILHRYYPLDEYKYNIMNWHSTRPLGISLGSIYKDKERIDLVVNELIPSLGRQLNAILCIDLAHGHSKHMRDTIQYIRSKNPDIPLISGNVCTPAGYKALISWGSDLVKVGVGPGSVCTTRQKTGCGYPQLQALMDCGEVTERGYEGKFIADGGIRNSGDICKALGTGARAVMVGSLFAGTDFSEACIKNPTSKNTYYRGMASNSAKFDFNLPETNEEGVSTKVISYGTGSTKRVLNSLSEGIKSCMSYIGIEKLSHFPLRTYYVEISESTKTENTAHFNNLLH